MDLSLSYFHTCEKVNKRYDYLGLDAMEFTVGEALRGTSPDAALSLYASSLSLARPMTGKEFEGTWR